MFDFLTVIPLIGGTLSVILPFLIVLGIVIFVHEYGHYIVGRWCGIHAEAFSLGFGPIVWSWYDKHGTRWQIAALPLGGFVKFLGDANSASVGADQETMGQLTEAERSRTFPGAKLWKRALTVFAGPGANFVLSVFIFGSLAMSTGVSTDEPVVGELQQFPGVINELRTGDRIVAINGVPISKRRDIEALNTDERPGETRYTVQREGSTLTVPGPFPWLPIVAGVNPVTPAAKAGLRRGDLILSFAGQEIYSFPQLQTIVPKTELGEIPMRVQRGEETLDLVITPREMPYQKEDGSFGTRIMIGIGGTVAFGPEIESIGPFSAAYYGARTLIGIVEGWTATIYHLITGGLSVKNLQGPVGIAVASSDSASQGLTDFVFLIGFISTAIGLMNLLPIPVLDGGSLVIFAYQAIFRREPNEKVMQVVMASGLSLLLLLMVFATFNDILRL